jgi:transcriptional regulator with XRE-family HTH domain
MNISKGITEKEADNMKDKELRRIIGERAKSRRTELNLTQPYVADKMGVTASTIQRYEAGTIDNTKKMVLEGLSEALHVSVEWLKGETDSYETDITDKKVHIFDPYYLEKDYYDNNKYIKMISSKPFKYNRIVDMKRFKKLLSVMALGVLLITNVVPVSAAEKIQSTKIESLSELDLDTYTQELMEADDGIQLYAPAPALTQFKLLLINSEKAGQETIQNSSSSMQVGSRLDHGGTWFQAITAEVGYAKTRYAYFNGVRMTLTASEPMYLDSDNIVDGYYCLWTYEGSEYEAGTFTANSTSANSPWNTMSLRFNVY